MHSEWIKVGPMLKWGGSGAFFGAVGGALWFVMRNSEWPDKIDTDQATIGAWAGGVMGLILGFLVVFCMVIIDRNRYDIQKRQAAEMRDPKIVPELYQDISDGYDTDAWHAIGLLIDYRDTGITKSVLEYMEQRFQNKEVYTADPGALVRHAVKSILRTRHLGGMEALKPYGRDFESRLGVEVRRLKRDLKEINKITSSSATIR
jgi:hypothetical protein